MTPQRLMWVLGLAGLGPFFIGGFGVWWLEDLLLALAQRGFILYSLAILCFLAGTLWGETLPEPMLGQRAAILVSNGVVLFAVLAMLIAQPLITTLLLMLGHLAQLWFERQKPGRSLWYTRLRSVLTLGAVFCHMVFAVGMMARSSA